MSQTRAQALNTLRIFLSDMKDQKWTEDMKIHFLNQALQDVVSSESIPYVRVSEIAIRNNNYEYNFPSDMLEPVAMMFQDIEGSIIISSSWRSLLTGNDIGNSLVPYDNSVFWQQSANASGHITLRDIVSDDKFIFTPKYQADQYSFTVHEQATLPDAATEQEIWVDTFESENYVYQCNETYASSGDQANATVGADLLAGSADLAFEYDIAGIKYVNVVINRAGASGVSALVITGDADDRSDPLTYTYNLYDDQNSNNTIIALTTGDMTVTGSDATDGTITPTSIELANPSADKWTLQVIHLRYVAIFPAMANDTDELPAELPVLIREGDCLAYIAASKMLMAMKGDERLLIMARSYKKEAREILDRCHMHRANNGPPLDLEPS